MKFPKVSTTRATQILGLIHSDVCGPLQSATHMGCKYFVTFIDDFSRYAYVYLLKHKSEVFDKFIQYKQLVETQTNKRIKIL